MDIFSNIRGLWVLQKMFTQSQIVNFTKNFELNYLIAATSKELLGDNLLRLVLVNEPHYTLFPNLYYGSKDAYSLTVYDIDMMIPTLPYIRGKFNSTYSLVPCSSEFYDFWFTQLIFVRELETTFSLFYDLERKKFVVLEFHSKAQITFKLFSSFHFSFDFNNSNGIVYIYSEEEELILATTAKISSYGWVYDQIHYSYDENSRGTGLYYFLLGGEIL